MFVPQKYIRIPFKYAGSQGYEGCNCYGLAALILEEEFNKKPPKFPLAPDDEIGESIEQRLQAFGDDWHVVEEPEPGDIALMWDISPSIVSHIAIKADERWWMTTMRDRGVYPFQLNDSPLGRYMSARIVEFRRYDG